MCPLWTDLLTDGQLYQGPSILKQKLMWNHGFLGMPHSIYHGYITVTWILDLVTHFVAQYTLVSRYTCVKFRECKLKDK